MIFFTTPLFIYYAYAVKFACQENLSFEPNRSFSSISY